MPVSRAFEDLKTRRAVVRIPDMTLTVPVKLYTFLIGILAAFCWFRDPAGRAFRGSEQDNRISRARRIIDDATVVSQVYSKGIPLNLPHLGRA
jgi:hypothetical protein